MSKISDEIMANRVHFGFTSNQLKAGVVGSLAATFLATMFGEWFPALGWTAFSFNTLNAEVWATNFKSLSGFFPVTTGQLLSADFTYFLGMWAHYAQGLFFGLLFAFVIYPNLPGGMGVGKNLLKGLVMGWTLFIVSTSFVMPLLYGTGFWFQRWGVDFGLGQAQLIWQNFVWHSIYGLVLGIFYSPVPKSEAGMGTTPASSLGSMGSIAHWGQVILGWVVLVVGGYISSSGVTFSAKGAYIAGPYASWGVLGMIVGLALVGGPSFSAMRKKK
jgi:hypothetical protein